MSDQDTISPSLAAQVLAEFEKDWRKELRRSMPVKERMKGGRRPMPQRAPGERNKDFAEVNLGLGAEEAVAEARRCLDCAKPGCIAGCPVRIDIPSFVKLVEKGEFAAAAAKVREANSLPAVCGRVCPQESQCEEKCALRKATGVAVGIGNLERFVSDYERREGGAVVSILPPSTGRKVAVVGAGPSGMTVAGELARAGHRVTIFEALHDAGGVLVYGIPEFRLPKSILVAEISYLRRLGVEFRMNFIVGKTATIDDLRADGYEVFFIGSGAGLPNFMKVPGENLVGVYSANEYLTRVNLMRAYDFPRYDTPVFPGRRAAVIGGGNVAMDSVRTAKRLGAERALIIYRRSSVEMPARVEEVHHAEEEGIEFHFLTVPTRYIGDEHGRVKAMECLRMELGEPDASGRRRPVPVPGSEFTAEVDLVVVAIGQSPNPLIPQTTVRAMPKIRSAVLALLAVAAGSVACGRPPVERADLILTNAVVATMAAREARAGALAVTAGKIVFVGARPKALRLRGPSTRVVDLGGRLVLPAFQDSHVHLIAGGVELGLCDLNGLGAKEDVLAKVRDYAAAHPDAAWITGGGWDLPLFPQANPRKEDLDAIVAGRPVVLDSADGHSAWVNSRALALAGITRDTPDPAGGRIERDPKTGVPSGTLRESAADLVERLVPETSPADSIRGLRAGLALANRFGIVSIIEASAGPETLDAYAALDKSGQLTVRVLASLYVDTDRGIAEVRRLAGLRRRYAGGRLKATAAKIFADGVMEPHTAALLEPYIDRPGDRGTPLLEPEAFDALARALDLAGFQIHVHAIGDRAVRMALDAFEAAGRSNGFRDMRHHIAHLELIDPADIPRFKQLGAAANFQALWAYADTYITDLTLPLLGPRRSRWLYPIGSVARTGARIAGGSDWSVSSMNPLLAIQVALTRRGPDAPPGEAWIPEERVDLMTMLRAYTVNGAWLSHDERTRGTLEAGKAADLIVLDRDLFAIPASEIGRAKVLLTLLDGREVFRDPALKD